MASPLIEGDLTQISERQLKYIGNVIEKLGYANNKVKIEPLGQVGDNYLANVKRISIDDGKGGTFKMVAKTAPAHEKMRIMSRSEELFRNEHIMYTKVLPKFTQLEISAGVPPEERLKYAACYGSLDEAPNEVILLEDLKESNFLMLDKLKPLSEDCVKSVLKNFALLHSLSYVLKHKEPLTFAEYKNSLYDLWGNLEGKKYILKYFEQVESITYNFDDSGYKDAIKGVARRTIKDLNKMASYEKDSKHAIIQQGDAWTNNIMFKFDGEKLLDSILIDYQVSKPTSPAVDILFLISNCTNYELRNLHYHEWIDYYHSELDKSLSNYGLKASLAFPRDQLDADLKRHGKTSFGHSIIMAGILSQKAEEAAAFKNAMETADIQGLVRKESSVSADPETTAMLKKKIEGLVDSYKEFGLI